MKEAEHERPDRSHSEPREIEERGSLMIVIHPCVFDDTTVRAWLTRTHASAPGSAVVTIEVEDLEMRARRSLTAGLTRAFISTLVELRKMRRIGERSPVVDGHRSWCSRLENEGEPHRSQELEAAEEHNGTSSGSGSLRGPTSRANRRRRHTWRCELTAWCCSGRH